MPPTNTHSRSSSSSSSRTTTSTSSAGRSYWLGHLDRPGRSDASPCCRSTHFSARPHAELRHRLPRRQRDRRSSSPSRSTPGEIRKTPCATAGFHDTDVVKYVDATRPDARTPTCSASAPSRRSPSSRPSSSRRRCAHEGRRRRVKQVRVLRGRRQDLPPLRQAGRAAEIAGELAQGAGRQHQPGAALRPPRGQHLRGDRSSASTPRCARALDAQARRRRGRAAIPSVESVGAKAGKRAARRRHQVAALRHPAASWSTSPFRFDFRYGPGTVVALLHDAVITMGAFAVTYKEFSLTTIAAILTIIGYSMNDTIVVFDRIRENAAAPARPASSTASSTSRSTRRCRAPS